MLCKYGSVECKNGGKWGKNKITEIKKMLQYTVNRHYFGFGGNFGQLSQVVEKTEYRSVFYILKNFLMVEFKLKD